MGRVTSEDQKILSELGVRWEGEMDYTSPPFKPFSKTEDWERWAKAAIAYITKLEKALKEERQQ